MPETETRNLTDHQRALDIALRLGPTGRRFLMSEVPLYSGLGFRDSGSQFGFSPKPCSRIWGIGCRVWVRGLGCVVRVWGLGLGSRVLSFCSRVPEFGFRILGFRSRVSVLRIRFSVFGFAQCTRKGRHNTCAAHCEDRIGTGPDSQA